MKKTKATLSFYFEIKDAQIYAGETGYVEQKIDLESSNVKLLKAAKIARKGIASLCKVPVEKVRIITRTEYENNVDDTTDDLSLRIKLDSNLS